MAVYLPGPSFSGRDYFQYTISDGNGGFDTAGVLIARTEAFNRPPAARPDSASTEQNIPVIIRVVDNDSDPDNDPLSVALQANPSHGTAVLQSSQQFLYSPGANYVGKDQFSYRLSDGRGGVSTAVVTITVGGGCAQNVTRLVQVIPEILTTIPGRVYISQVIRITNLSRSAITGPISLVLDPHTGTPANRLV